MNRVPFLRVVASSRPFRFALRLVIGLLALGLPAAVHANVYATNIRLNGGTNNVVVGTGGSVTIGYLLNDAATAGVTVQVISGGVPVRTITVPGGGPGTVQGVNSVVWDGKDDNTNQVVSGTYSIQITASANGYGDWTQFSNDADTYAAAPRGIAVNRNTNSLFYGRVFVSNGTNLFGGSSPGDLVGIQKFNADASPAAEGGFSDGGWPWAGDGFSPWKIEVSADDYIYIGDFNLTNNGAVVRFDQTLSTNSQTAILRTDNRPGVAARLSGPFVTGRGTNTQIWMADASSSGAGIRRWNVAVNGAVATNDTGRTTVQAGSLSQLDVAPYDVAVDVSNRIYSVQSVLDSGDPSYRLFRFASFTNTVETNATWRVGSGDDNLIGASGVAVDPTATYVAVACLGTGTGLNNVGGSVMIFDAGTGASVGSPLDFNHDHTDVAWDNVGNLYVCDNNSEVWRAFSPPGASQATTVALQNVQVSAPPPPPLLTQPSFSTGQFHFTLAGQPNVSYVIQVSTNVFQVSTNPLAWLPILTNNAPTSNRTLSVTAPASQSFYRAAVAQ